MTNKQSTELTYENAWAELQQIVGELQAGTVNIDLLTIQIERAAVLVQFCRERLRATEQAVEKLAQ